MTARGGFGLVVAADWSAAQGRSPTPRPDRCWTAFAHASQPAADREPPRYHPTRLEAEAAIADIVRAHGRGRRVLLGLDFAIGYPLAHNAAAVLPIGRELAAMLAGRITDDERGRNNRFEVAAGLNNEIVRATGVARGPFWGRPRGRPIPGLPPTQPAEAETGVRRFRACETDLRARGLGVPKSAWQLLGAGSVGSQSLVGLPMVHRLLTDDTLGPRAHLWPFEPPPDRPDAITIAEIYPSLFDRDAEPWASVSEIKDARQVAAACEGLLKMPAPGSASASAAAEREGAILTPAPTAAVSAPRR